MRIGDGWFDEDWHPIFNDAKGVQAIEMMKEIAQYAQQGFTAAANDECMIAYQQDTGVMGLQWASRAKAMDDPNKSRVVGKIDWAAPPQGHGRNSGDGYAISAFSKQDPDTLFRIIATSASQTNMRGAASLLIPPRKSLLDDAELRAGQPLLSGGARIVRRRHARAGAAGVLRGRRIHHPAHPAGGHRRDAGEAGARHRGDRDHRLPQGPRLLQVTSGAAIAARFSGPEGSWWLFLVPSALVLAAVMLYPLGYAIWLSLFNYDLGSGARDFIGLGNYAALLTDARFWDTLNRTVADRAGRGRAGVLPRPAGRVRAVPSDLRRAHAEPADVPAQHRHAGGGGAVPALDLHRPLGIAERRR